MIRPSLRLILATATVAVVCLVMTTRPGAAAQKTELERFLARAVDTSGPTPQDAGPIDIVIGLWSTDADDDVLRTAVAEGPDRLLPALQKVRRPVGVVLSPGIQAAGARALERRRQGILFAREIKVPEGRRVIVATDEYPGFVEPDRNKTHMSNNEFTLIDLRLRADGTGVGKIGSAAQVTFNKETNTIELTDYAGQPARLVDVRSARR